MAPLVDDLSVASVDDTSGVNVISVRPSADWTSVISVPRSAVADEAEQPQVGDLIRLGHGMDARAVIIMQALHDRFVAVDVT